MTESVARRKHKRPRPQTSCAVCHRRKVKCNNELPCGPCIRHGCQDECRFDGIPARNGQNGSAGLQSSAISTTPSDSDQQVSPGQQLDENDVERLPFNTQQPAPPQSTERDRSLQLLDETSHSTQTQPFHSRLPTHDWIPQQGPVRGRTHTLWLLRTFDPLLVYMGRDRLGENPINEDNTWMNRNREQEPLPQAHQFAGSVYDKLPPSETCHELVARYFDTFDTVYSIINRNIFAPYYNILFSDPKGVPICFVIKVLVMMAIANTTYPPDEAPVSKSSIAEWMDLASSVPPSALEAGDFMLHTAHIFTTLSLAEQLLKLDATAAYIRSATYVRTAMVLDLHRVEVASEKRRVWEAIMDLDLHASLAAGVMPASPLPAAPNLQPSTVTCMYSNDNSEDLSDVLPRSLHVRHKIVTLLNSEKHLQFEQIVELSSELTKAMAPVSTSDNVPQHRKTFLYRYLSFTYGRFLAALHRPFFLLSDPAFYLSRTMITRLATQYMKEIIAVYNKKAGSDPFAHLLIGHGIMFRNEHRQAQMAICYEMLRSGDDTGDLDVHAFLNSPSEGKSAVKNVFGQLLGIAEPRVKKKEIPESSFLIPAMVYAHICAVARFPRDSEGYAEAMAHAAVEAEAFCPPSSREPKPVVPENAF
ncbi:hypothetical protein M409DRAFT_52917 [Zasmidium cellare ATCC 36951]|uniref:Zn(2)-C6 fungal-type domain-containing protein n=1 Tax=Zasmidium cellare ATCC 36951 TaxID=1080233 RepID=A0A6A6CS06_ZASCE|nr:uncharacterized protein M409DRAFT_52917 [Zasmidium cellare ATCC 36951]KAF2168930.1 hypothetical protein M409DRAFT_52917 [Zasmidium cellare ATCC 36951]